MVGVDSKPFANTKMPLDGVEEGPLTTDARGGLQRVFQVTEGEPYKSYLLCLPGFFSSFHGNRYKLTASFAAELTCNFSIF